MVDFKGGGRLERFARWGLFGEWTCGPDGGKLALFRDAANYITGLPNEESTLPEWQVAIEALMLVVDLGGPTMFARTGVMPPLNRHYVREFDPGRKKHHWGKRKLKRDQ